MAGLVTRVFDALRPPQASPAVVQAGTPTTLSDGYANAATGFGTNIDPMAQGHHYFRPLSQYEIEASYRGSWITRKLIDKPARDIVRARRDWQADKASIGKLEAEEKRLRVWERLEEAEQMRGQGGGAILVWIEGDDPETPVDPKRIKAGGISSLSCWSRWELTLGDKVFDLNDPLHNQPSYYEVNNLSLITSAFGVTNKAALRFHPSRVIPFRAKRVSCSSYGWQDKWWGDSTVQTSLQAVLNADATQSGFVGLVKDAVNVLIGVPGITERMSTAPGKAEMQNRMSAVAYGRSMLRAIFYDSGNAEGKGGEKVEFRQTSWAGIPDVLMTFFYPVAASENMPATILVGKSPDGMNASGTGDQNMWDDEVDGRRETLTRPCIEALDTMLIPSALGKVDDSVWWDFGALRSPSAKEQADTAFSKAQAIKIYADNGLLPTIALEKGVQNMLVEDRLMPGLDDALSEIPENERFPSLSVPEPELDANGNPIDPSALQGGGDLLSRGGSGANGSAPVRRAANDARFTDAAPKSLYVERKLLNTAEFIAWAKGQGFETATPADELHVTIAYSRTPLDWMKIGQDWSSDKDGRLTVNAGGPRIVQGLGDKGAAVLLFGSNDLKWRHEAIREAGASFDFDEYQPHVTITYQAPAGLDLSKVKPYAGPLVFGPELFSEINEDWSSGITEE